MTDPPTTSTRILDSACYLFSESGYEATTLADVAKRAGLTTGSVYSNFEGKRELFLACLRHAFGKFPPVVVPDPDDVEVTLEETIEASTLFVTMIREDPIPFRLFLWGVLERHRDSELEEIMVGIGATKVPAFNALFAPSGSVMVGSLLLGLGVSMLGAERLPDAEIRRIVAGSIRAAHKVGIAEKDGAPATIIEVIPPASSAT